MPKAASASSSKSLRFRLVHRGTTLKRWTVNDGHIVMPVEDTQSQDLNPIDDQEQLGQVFSSLDLGRSPSSEAHSGGRKSSKKLRKKSVRFHPHARHDERSDSDRDATSPPPTAGARPTSPSSWSISRTTRAIVGGVKKHIKGRLRSLSPPPVDSSLIPTRPNTPSPQPSSSTASPVCHRPAWEHGRLYGEPSQLDDFEDTELFTEHWAPSCAPATVPEVADELAPYEEIQEPAPVLGCSDAPFMGTVSLPEVTDDVEDKFATEAYIPSDAVDEDARPGVDWDEYNLPTEVTDCKQAANVEYEGDCDSNDDGNDSEDEDEAAQNVPTEPNTPVLQLQALQLCEAEPVSRPVSEEEVVDILHEAVDEAIINELAQQDFGDIDVRSHRHSSAPSLDLPKPEDFFDVPGLTLTPPTPPSEAVPRTPPAHHSDLAPTPVHTRSCSAVPLVFDEIERSRPPTSDMSAFTSRVESTSIEKLAPPQSLPLFPQAPAKSWPAKGTLPVPKNMVFNYTSHKVEPMFADHLPRFAPAPPTTVYHFEIDVVMDVDRLEEDMEMDDAASLCPSHPQYAIPPYLPPQYHLSQYPHPLYPPPQYHYPRYPLSPPPRYTSRRRTTTTRSGHILNFGRPSPPRQLPRPSCLRRSSSPPSAAHRRVRTPRRLQNRNSVKRSYRRRNLAATRQKRLRSLQRRAQRAIAASSSDEDDAMDGASSVAYQWAPIYYPRRSYSDLPDEDEEMSDESAQSPLVGADHSTRDASPNAWQPELTVQVPVATLPLPVTEATPRTIVEQVPQIAAPSEVADVHQARDANIVGSSTGATDLAATPAVANVTVASAAASTAASTASTTSEAVFGTPTPAPPVELAPATPEVTERACPEPIPRPVIASSVPALDYLASTQTWRDSRPIDDDDDDDDPSQWEVVVAPLPRAPAASTSAPAPATLPATASRESEGFQQASIQEAQDTVAAPGLPTTATSNTSPASVAAQQEAETAAALLSLADAARAKSANGGGSSRRREENLARELARKKIIEAAKALQQQQANVSPEDHAPASADEQPSSNPNPDASASHTHHRTEAGVDEQSEEHAPPTPRVDKGKGKDTSSANQPPEEVATTVIDPEVVEELAKSLLTEEEREFNMNPRVWSTFNNRRSRPAPLDLSKPGPSRLPGYSLSNDVPAVQVGSFVKSATIPTARDKNHEASNDIVLVGVSSPPASDAPSAENAMDVTSPSRSLDREGDLNVLTVSEKWQTPTPPPAKSASGPDSIPTIEITPPSPDAASSEPEPSLATPDDIFDAIDAPDTPAKMAEDDGDDDDDDFPEPLWQRTPPKPALPKADRPTRQLPRRLGKQHATRVTPMIHAAAAVPVAVSSYSSLAGALGDLSSASLIPSAPNSSSPATAKISVTAGNAQRSNASPSPDVIHCLDSNAGVAKLAYPVSPRQEVVAHVTVDAPKLVKDSSVAPSPSPASSISAEDAHTQEALLLLAFAQTPRIDTSRTSQSAPAAPLPATPDIMDGVEASLAEDFAVTLDDDAMNADLSLFDDLPYEECCTPAPSPAYYPYEAAYSPYEAAYSPYEAAYSPYEVAYSPYEAADSPYEAADSPYEAADSPYYGDLSHVASPAAIDDMHTDDVSSMADQALQILADLKAQQTVHIRSSHEVTMFEPIAAGEGQPIAMVGQGEGIGGVSDHRMDDASAAVTDARTTYHTPPVRDAERTTAEFSAVSDSAGAAEPLDIVTERVDPAARGPQTPEVSLPLPRAHASNPVPDSPTSLPEGEQVEQILAVSPERTNTGLQPVEIAHSKRDAQAFNATKEADSSVVSQGSASVSAALSSKGKVQDLVPQDDLPEGESSDTSASASAEEIDAVSQPETPAEPSMSQPTLVSSHSDSVQQAVSAKVEAAPEQRRDTPALLVQSEKKANSPETTSPIEQSDVCPGVQSTGIETSASSSASPGRLDVASRPLSSRATRRRHRVARALSSFLGMPCTTPFSVLQFALDGGYSDLNPKHHGPEHRRHVPYQRTEWSERRLKAKSSWQKRAYMLSDIPEVVLEDVVSSLKSEGLKREYPFASGVDSAVEAARKQASLERSRLRELPCFKSKAVQTDPLPHEKPLPVGEDRSEPARAPSTRTRRDATVQVPPVVEDKPKASESRDTRPLPSRPSGASSRRQPASESKKGSAKVDGDKRADAPRALGEKQSGSQSKPSSRQRKAKNPRPRPATSAEASEKKKHSESLPRFDRPRPSQPPPRSRRPYCSGRYSANFDLDDESDSESPEVSAPTPTPAPQASGGDNSRAVVLANSRLGTEPQRARTGDEEAIALVAFWARWWPICLLFLLVCFVDRGL
ncbi:hypothetical protein PYCCODRAFT_1437662 [Trametes coccinea BRFM310]|uniref:Uncharacterized protein n=1 Tax=Trametes coccinea (strain BRFM310) TaxID=1353009 RepID=A0A1Y2IHK5_TRAC3|nr:hypothetical protein PYCCODRAFT_1437662 [Trametes coccinea BRFM310]